MGERPSVDRFVVLAAPHTSNWDAFYGLVAAFCLDLPLNWLCKIELFRGPLGWLLPKFGAIPVDRARGYDTALQVVELFKERPRLALAVTPEGTRSKGNHWRMGFYYIALGAGVPIVPCYLDYRRKVMGIGRPLLPSGDIRGDLEIFRRIYADVTARYPDQVSDVRLEVDVAKGNSE